MYAVKIYSNGQETGDWSDGDNFPSLRAAGIAVLRRLEVTLDNMEARNAPAWPELEEAVNLLEWNLTTRMYTGPEAIELPGGLELRVVEAN